MPYLMAKKYGLQLTALYDERREPEKATKAACLYIQELQNIYQDWRLTITAFRVGPARLNQVIHRVNTINFDTVYLALEPQEQLPIIQFFAASVALSEYLENRETELHKSPWGNRERVLSIERSLPFSFFEEHFDLSTFEMRNYNPALRTDQVPYMGEAFEFFLPKVKAIRFNENRDSLIFWLEGRPELQFESDTILQIYDGDTAYVVNPPSESDSVGVEKEENVWVYYRVKRGDALYTITDIFDCTIADIRRWNNVPRKNFLLAGKTLKFFVPANKKIYYEAINTMSLTQKRARAKRDD
jgi:membrane-bound lytic murein transglycosylase D